MSVYFRIFADTADASISVSNATYATARSATTATVTNTVQPSVGQSFSGANYALGQYFGQFDTSAVTAGAGTGSLSVNIPFAASVGGDTIELREASSLSNKIAGGSLSGLTLFGSVAMPTVGSARTSIAISDISGLSRSATLKLLLHSQNERLNVAPTGAERCQIDSADQAGTTSDPYLDLIAGNAWVFVGVSSVAEVTTTSHALTEPAGVAQGDLLVAIISSRIASTTAITLPSGGEWTLVTEQKNNNTATNTSATPSGMMAYCVRGASAPNLTFTHPTTPSVALGRIVAYRNVDSSSPKDTQTSFTTATNVTAVSGTGLTTAADDELIVVGACGGQEATWTTFAAATDPTTSSGTGSGITADPAPNVWQERADSNTVTGADTSLGIADVVKTAAGATGNLTVTASQGAAHVIVAGAFKLAPANNNKTLAAGAGSFSLTGTAATLKEARKVVPDAGAYALTGTAAALTKGKRLAAAAGSFALTGTAATLLHKWIISTGAGSFALTGTVATLKHGWKVTADAGSYSLTGTDAALKHGWKLAAAAGSFVLTGTDATLTKAGGLNNYTIAAGAGAFALTGSTASVLLKRVLSAGAGAYALTGTATATLHGWRNPAAAGSFALTGQAATLKATKRVVPDAGSFALSGNVVSLFQARRLTANSGAYLLTGTDVDLTTGGGGEATDPSSWLVLARRTGRR